MLFVVLSLDSLFQYAYSSIAEKGTLEINFLIVIYIYGASNFYKDNSCV